MVHFLQATFSNAFYWMNDWLCILNKIFLKCVMNGHIQRTRVNFLPQVLGPLHSPPLMKPRSRPPAHPDRKSSLDQVAPPPQDVVASTNSHRPAHHSRPPWPPARQPWRSGRRWYSSLSTCLGWMLVWTWAMSWATACKYRDIGVFTAHGKL